MFLNQLCSGCQSVGGDFDGLVQKMSEILPLAYKSMLELGERFGISFTGDYEKQTAILCGWSKQRNCVAGYSFIQLTEAKGFTGATYPPGASYWQPANDRQSVLPDLSTPEAMAQHARDQMQFIKESATGIHSGGAFIVAKIERDKMTIFPVCDLDNSLHPSPPPS